MGLARIAVIAFASTLGFAACTDPLPRDPAQREVHVVFDPAAGKIPMPNDLVRDEKAGHLTLPIKDGLPATEVEFREFLNTHDAWPTTFPLAADLSAPADPKSINAETVLVLEWGSSPKRLTDIAPR